jgi:hypothetical protein
MGQRQRVCAFVCMGVCMQCVCECVCVCVSVSDHMHACTPSCPNQLHPHKACLCANHRATAPHPPEPPRLQCSPSARTHAAPHP